MREAKAEPLNRRQREILDFLRAEIKTKGYPPTIREIGLAVGLRSTSSVHSHLNALETKGYIRRSPIELRAKDETPGDDSI